MLFQTQIQGEKKKNQSSEITHEAEGQTCSFGIITAFDIYEVILQEADEGWHVSCFMMSPTLSYDVL